MSVSYYADRANLYDLHQHHPDWSAPMLACALTRSLGWVKKWLARLRDELAQGMALPQVLQGHPRTRHHPPRRTEPWVVDQVLAVRDAPPEGLRRVPGAQAIQYYLPRDPFWQQFQPPVPSRRTIHRILQAHGRIPLHHPHRPQPMERPAPLSHWQIDFKDVSSVPAEPLRQATTWRRNAQCDRYGNLPAPRCAPAARLHRPNGFRGRRPYAAVRWRSPADHP